MTIKEIKNIKKPRRILLKLSGESLTGGNSFGIDAGACRLLTKGIKTLRDTGVEIGIVIGGGNIFRGKNLESIGIARSPADLMGMLATLINGTALQASLENEGCRAKVFTALECPKVAESYTWRAATQALGEGFVAIFVGGTGNPYFTTDTAAALRAAEIQADIFLKATKVDGVYSKDPLKHKDAIRYRSLSYEQVLEEKLEIMDATAVTLCRDNKIPILVFDMKNLQPDTISGLLSQHDLGTYIKETP